MEESSLTDVDKIAITLAVVFASLLIAALASIVCWYYNVARKRHRYEENVTSRKPAPLRSISVIEKELRDLNRQTHVDSTTVNSNTNPPQSTDRSKPPPVDPTVDLKQVLQRELGSITSSGSGSSAPTSDIVVIRQGREKLDVRLRSLVDTHIGTKAAHSYDDTYSLNDSPLPDTRISTISSDGYSLSTQDSSYGGLLWPDVVDPYNRGQELEQKIGGKAIDMSRLRSMATAL